MDNDSELLYPGHPSWDQLLSTTMNAYKEVLAESLFTPSVLMQHIDPDWIAEQKRLDEIGPRHHPDWSDLCEIQLDAFMAEFDALCERFPGVHFSSYDEIDINLGSAYRPYR